MHAWHESIDSIGLASYIVVKVYEHNLGLNQFAAVHTRVAALQVSSFLHVPSDHFLCKLPGEHIITNQTVRLSNAAYSVYSELNRPSSKSKVAAAVKLLDSVRKQGEKRAEAAAARAMLASGGSEAA